MTDLIREKAEDLIEALDSPIYGTDKVGLAMEEQRRQKAKEELRAALRPSREDIADWLEGTVNKNVSTVDYERYINLAAEELRKEI